MVIVSSSMAVLNYTLSNERNQHVIAGYIRKTMTLLSQIL